MQVVSAVARPCRTTVVGQEVGEQQITPAAAIVQWRGWLNGFDVAPGAWDKHRVADEHEPVRGGWFAANWLAPDSNVRHLHVLQRPAGYGDRSGDASSVVQRRIETSKGRTWYGARHVHLD